MKIVGYSMGRYVNAMDACLSIECPDLTSGSNPRDRPLRLKRLPLYVTVPFTNNQGMSIETYVPRYGPIHSRASRHERRIGMEEIAGESTSMQEHLHRNAETRREAEQEEKERCRERDQAQVGGGEKRRSQAGKQSKQKLCLYRLKNLKIVVIVS